MTFNPELWIFRDDNFRFEPLGAVDRLPDDPSPSAERIVSHIIACLSDQNNFRRRFLDQRAAVERRGYAPARCNAHPQKVLSSG